MDPSHEYSIGSPDRYSARRSSKPVSFRCNAPKASSVFIAGDFNEWRRDTHPLERGPDGCWSTQIAMSHGHHHYLFIVDDEPTLDPNAQGIARNERNERVSMIAIS